MVQTKFSEEDLKDFWDETGASHSPFSDAPSSRYYFRRECWLFSRFFGRLSGKKLMKTDLWNEAKTTKILAWARMKGAEVHGFDISKKTLDEASENMRKEGLKFNFRLGDIRKIPFRDSQFDFVYSMGTVEHTPQYQQSISELRRVLKPGGIAIVGVPNKYPVFDPVKYFIIQMLDRTGIATYPYGYEKHFTRNEFRLALRRAGFDILEESSILLMPFSLRAIDLFLYRRHGKLAWLSKPLLHAFEYMENKSSMLRRKGGYLWAFVVTK